MRNLIPLLLTLMCQSFLQAQLPGSETQRFFKIAVSNSHTAKPFGSFSSLFYQNFHPGVELGYETILADKRKHQWIFETRAGYLFHRYVQHNIALLANAGYRYGPLPGWSAEIKIGAGYQHSIADSKLFEITETEGLKKKRNMGRSQAIGAFSVGVSRKISAIKQSRMFIEYRQLIQTPFIQEYVPLLPYNTMLIGFAFQLKQSNSKQ